jgi:hypothetical protein
VDTIKQTPQPGDRVADAYTLRETGTVTGITPCGVTPAAVWVAWDRNLPGTPAMRYAADTVVVIRRPVRGES